MTVCTKHNDSETGLSCSTCDRPFCHLCLHQGPVGSKCRECSKGIPITTTTRERTTANVAYVAKDRLFALKAVMATVLAIDALVLLATKTDFLTLTGSYTGPTNTPWVHGRSNMVNRGDSSPARLATDRRSPWPSTNVCLCRYCCGECPGRRALATNPVSE